MAFPTLLVMLGLLFLFMNTGWTFNFSLDMALYWPIVLILIGLVLMLKRRY